MVFPNNKSQANWAEILKRFTVQLNPKNDYSFSRVLGTGVSSKVYLAMEKGKILGKQYAVKTIKKDYFKESTVNFESVIREIRI